MQRLDESFIQFNINTQNQSKISQTFPYSYKLTKTCPNSHLLHEICLNQKCSFNNKFICLSQQCQHNLNHFGCQKQQISTIMRKIHKKSTQKMNKLKQQITNIFQDIMDKISELQQHFIKQIDNKLQNIQLFSIQNKFYEYFNTSTNTQLVQKIPTQYFTSFNLLTISQLISPSHIFIKQLNQFFNKSTQNLHNFSSSTLKSIQLIKSSIQNIFIDIVYYKHNYQQKLQRINKIIKNPQSCIIKNELQLLKTSSILMTQQQIQNLIKFFNFGKKVKNLTLKFKASENNFNIKTYYQQCGHLPQTIILVQTIYNKIIGGYTPLPFSSQSYHPSMNQCIPDPSRTSFIFSLSSSFTHKFTLNPLKSPLAIFHNHTHQSICFNGSSLRICNNANNNDGNQMYLGYNVYINENNQNMEAKNMEKELIGKEGSKFKIKEYQVIQVQFQQKDM